MRLYLDKDLTNEVEENQLDLGRLEVGKTKQYSLWIANIPAKNEVPVHLENIKIEFSHPEIKIIKAPTNMLYNQIDEIVLEWQAKVDLQENLKTRIGITALAVYVS